MSLEPDIHNINSRLAQREELAGRLTILTSDVALGTEELGFHLPGIAKSLVKGLGKAIGSGAGSLVKSAEKAIIGEPGSVVKQVEKSADLPQAVKQVKQATSSDTFKEGEHPRGPDGKFIDKSKGSAGKAIDVSKAAAGAILDKQYQEDLAKWTAKRDEFDKKELDAKSKDANNAYDNADRRLRLVENYKSQLTDAQRLGVDESEIKKIQSNIDKNAKKAEEYRLKGDNIWKKPSKTYDVPQPSRPTGFKGFKPTPPPQPKGTGVGLIPKPTTKIPPKAQPQRPSKVPRLTPAKRGK